MSARIFVRNASAVLPITVLALSLAACSGGTQTTTGSASASTPPEAKALTEGIPTQVISTTENKDLSAKLPAGFDGTLDVAIDLTGPPARLTDSSGKPAGFDVDFANLLAEKLGVKVNVSNTPFAQIIPGLAAKRYDLTVNNMSRTPERETQLDMIEYMKGSGGIAFPAGNPKGVNQTPESLCGLRLGVLSGSYQEQTTVPDINKACAAAGKEAAKPTSYGTSNEAILALGSRRTDAWLGNGTIAAYAAAQQPQIFESTTLKNTWSHDNLGLPKGSELTPIVTNAFQELMDEGTYKKVLDKWGISDYSLDKASTVQTPVVQQ